MEEMVGKVQAAVEARVDPDFVLIARVDSRAVHGFKDAVRRGQAYREAGADQHYELIDYARYSECEQKFVR